MSNQPEYQPEFLQRFREIQGGLKNVQIALWANDYRLAHGFLRILESNHQDLLTRIDLLRRNLIKARNDAEDSIQQAASKHTGAMEWQKKFIKEYYFEEYQFNIIGNNQLEHELIPLQYEIQRYRKKINEALGSNELSQIIPDKLYEYRIMPIGSSDGQVKYRLYRFAGQINLSPNQFLADLAQQLDSVPQIVSKQDLIDEWKRVVPLCLRVFSEKFFLEITVFDHNRLEIMIISRAEEISEELPVKIIAILEKGYA